MSNLKSVQKIEVFRAPQYDADLPNAWYFNVAGQRDFCWRIVNPSGQGYIDQAYEGQGEQYVITPAQAKGEKLQTLVNCARYSARQILPKYGETATDATEIVIR